jgi:hypothetical protein
LADEHWKEVVPLAAVLAGRKVQPLIQHLIDLCKKSPTARYEYSKDYPVLLLSQCILDEIQIPPDLLEEGLEWIARRSGDSSELIQLLYRGRFGKTLQKVVQNAYISSNMDLPHLGSALAFITLDQINWTRSEDLTPQLVDKITTLLGDENAIQRAAGTLAVMIIAFYYSGSPIKRPELTADAQKYLMALGGQLVPILDSDEPYLYFSACWAFAWLGESGAWSPEHKPGVISRLLEIWRESPLYDVQRQAAWTISSLPIIARELKPLPEPDPELIDFIKQQGSLMGEKDESAKFKRSAALVIGFYWKTPWTDKELAQLLASEYGGREEYDRLGIQNFKSFLKVLGEAGMAQLEALEQKEGSRSRKLKAKSKKQAKKSQKRHDPWLNRFLSLTLLKEAQLCL